MSVAIQAVHIQTAVPAPDGGSPGCSGSRSHHPVTTTPGQPCPPPRRSLLPAHTSPAPCDRSAGSGRVWLCSRSAPLSCQSRLLPMQQRRRQQQLSHLLFRGPLPPQPGACCLTASAGGPWAPPPALPGCSALQETQKGEESLSCAWSLTQGRGCSSIRGCSSQVGLLGLSSPQQGFSSFPKGTPAGSLHPGAPSACLQTQLLGSPAQQQQRGHSSSSLPSLPLPLLPAGKK